MKQDKTKTKTPEQELVALRKENAQLKTLVLIDELTHVLNRRGFYKGFNPVFREALFLKGHPEVQERRRIRTSDVAVLFFDLDDFKNINDTYGHDAGDHVLKTVAKVLKENVRSIDEVARLGGEEFIVIMLGANENEAYKKAQELVDTLSCTKIEKHGDICQTASAGVAALSDCDADDLDELVGYADKAMYEAKQNKGKNTVVRWSEIKKS